MSELDLDLVRHALSLARTHGFAEVELSLGDDSFTARLAPGAPAPAAIAAYTAPDEPEVVAIKSKHVGYYKPASTPLAPGQTVAKGDVVATIAALGLANDVDSSVTGEVVEVLVQADQPVEYGQTIALVKKS